MEKKILEAAEQLFLEKGFAMTSTTEIAKIAGCNQALVHYYFRTKDHLFDAIFENKVRMFISTFMEISNEDIPFEEKLKRKIEAHFDMIRANPKFPFLIINELTTNPQRVEKIKAKISQLPKAIFGQLDKELDEEIRKGNIRPIKTIDLLFSIVSLNMVLFLAKPFIKTITNISDEDYEAMVEHRKKENVLMILRSLRP
ncbi:MAG: TetR/AcrR family transcriptional regulator [Bacteroidota bacterium]|nr:TetR/AcrR family transcriptional regulator [Bacteroidota bacterium]